MNILRIKDFYSFLNLSNIRNINTSEPYFLINDKEEKVKNNTY